jgi:phosphoserine phosphatase
MQLHAFDLDHTLLQVNSSYQFGSYLYQKNKLRFIDLFFCLIYYAKHKGLNSSLQATHEKVFKRAFQNHSLTDIKQCVDDFLAQHLTKFLYLPVYLRLQKAQAKNEPIILLSSSPDFLVEAIAKRLQITEYRATQYKVNAKQKFTSIEQVVDGEQKAFYLKTWIQKQAQATPYHKLTAYSDSYLDLPVLYMAESVVTVKPDRRLKHLAIQNGWEML